MFSIYRSQKNIDQKQTNFEALYLQQKRLREQFQKKAQVAELKYRKLSQFVNKKCMRCVNVNSSKNRQQQISILKQFHIGINLLGLQSNISNLKKQNDQGKLIQNFGIFGLSESALSEKNNSEGAEEGQLLYTSNCPSLIEQHTAKLSFPNGITPKMFFGNSAREKAIQIMSSSCSFSKGFVMSFQNPRPEHNFNCQIMKATNPQNRLFAVCMKIDDFTLLSSFFFCNEKFIESERKIDNKTKQCVNSNSLYSCEQIILTQDSEDQSHILIAPRIYCIFSYYPFFSFYLEILKTIINSIKTERLLQYKQSEFSLAQSDSHFYKNRVKQVYREVSQQISTWSIKFAKQFNLKINNQNIVLNLSHQLCSMNFVEDWGVPIFNMFSVDTFIQLFTLIILQQKVVIVSQNPTLLTFTIHLFTQLLMRPFEYAFPVISILPLNQGYYQTLCPFVYGVIGNKKTLSNNKTMQKFNNVFVFLENQGVQILPTNFKKQAIKKHSKILKTNLSSKFKVHQEKRRRSSCLVFTEQQTVFVKDKFNVCSSIIKQVNLYINQNIVKHFPSQKQVKRLIDETLLRKGQDLHQMVLEKIRKDCETKNKQDFFQSILNTQIFSNYIFR